MKIDIIELTSVGGPRVGSKVYIKFNEIVAIGEWFETGTTIILKNESRDILVKETPEQIMIAVKAAL